MAANADEVEDVDSEVELMEVNDNGVSEEGSSLQANKKLRTALDSVLAKLPIGGESTPRRKTKSQEKQEDAPKATNPV